MLLALLSIALTVQDSTDVVFRKGHFSIIAPSPSAAEYAVIQFGKSERDFYRVDPKSDGTFELMVNSYGFDYFYVAKLLRGKIEEDGIHVARTELATVASKSSPRVHSKGDKTVLDADESGMHETIFALMSFASKSYQVGPFRGGGGKIVIHVESTTLERNIGMVLRQVDGIFLQDGEEWIVLDGAGARGRKSAGYKAMDTMFGCLGF